MIAKEDKFFVNFTRYNICYQGTVKKLFIMKMKLAILVLALISVNVSIAQKVKIKDNIATVDGEAFLNWEKRAMGSEASISGVNSDEEEISAMYLDYIDNSKITSSNPEGKVRWIEIYFPTLDIKCEVTSRTHKGLAKMIYQSNLYVDGVLNPTNAERFVKKYGMKFSDNRPNKAVNININTN